MLFPNSFPYARYNWVVVLSEEHFLPIDNFSVEILRDGFLVAQEGIERVRKKEPKVEILLYQLELSSPGRGRDFSSPSSSGH